MAQMHSPPLRGELPKETVLRSTTVMEFAEHLEVSGVAV
jgi:hypothetical protein